MRSAWMQICHSTTTGTNRSGRMLPCVGFKANNGNYKPFNGRKGLTS